MKEREKEARPGETWRVPQHAHLNQLGGSILPLRLSSPNSLPVVPARTLTATFRRVSILVRRVLWLGGTINKVSANAQTLRTHPLVTESILTRLRWADNKILMWRVFRNSRRHIGNLDFFSSKSHELSGVLLDANGGRTVLEGENAALPDRLAVLPMNDCVGTAPALLPNGLHVCINGRSDTALERVSVPAQNQRSARTLTPIHMELERTTYSRVREVTG